MPTREGQYARPCRGMPVRTPLPSRSQLAERAEGRVNALAGGRQHARRAERLRERPPRRTDRGTPPQENGRTTRPPHTRTNQHTNGHTGKRAYIRTASLPPVRWDDWLYVCIGGWLCY